MADEGLRVLVIDDSAVVRETVSRLLGKHAGWEVTTAMDSVIALERLRKERPQVVLLDLEMPRMDGLTFLRHLMATDPLPVVVCSGHADHGTQAAITALELGAVAILPKPKLAVRAFLEDSGAELMDTLRRAAAMGPSLQPGWSSGTSRPLPPLVLGGERLVSGGAPQEPEAPDPPDGVRRPGAESGPDAESDLGAAPVLGAARGPGTESGPAVGPGPGRSSGRASRVVLLGASMGGAEALHRVIAALPADGPPCLVALHMPEPFTAAFAQRLNSQVAMEVREAVQGDAVVPGRVLVAPGGFHMRLRRGVTGPEVELSGEPPLNGHRPSIDVLFHSAAGLVGRSVVAALLTGMGEDGAEGLLALRNAGASTLVQDRATSTVFGMPRAALQRSAAQEVLPIDEIGPRLVELAGTPSPEGGEGHSRTTDPPRKAGNGSHPETR